ncbi:hypothetical protein ACQKOH_18120 [Sphingomonas sp. NPDC092331]|jgi:hypothetical protein|uniref:EF-hand domain-containing protein n=1 Tax=unclassified Sphingomonas TaxID=196159 RepID=UPI0029EECC1C|nr:EF-hand domain-containing protein [Pseudomonadota bacterium]
MTGPIRTRQAMALAGMLALCGCMASGAALRGAGSAVLVARFDADRDGGLDRTELAAMIAAAVRGQGMERDALRAGLAAGYWTRDCNRDGRLTATEMAASDSCG